MERPYRIPCYQAVSVLVLLGWIFLFVTSDWHLILYGIGFLALGVLWFLIWSWRCHRWPFAEPPAATEDPRP